MLRLVVAGDGRHTPRLWALRAHRPRFSYLQQYLPDLYQEDPDAADFLDRYLANVEGPFTALEGRIESAQVLFGVTSLDTRHLGWLGGWLGAAVDPAWDEARVRLLLEHAVELFGRRGTVRGLVESIRLATDPCPDSSIFDGSPPPSASAWSRASGRGRRRARRSPGSARSPAHGCWRRASGGGPPTGAWSSTGATGSSSSRATGRWPRWRAPGGGAWPPA